MRASVRAVIAAKLLYLAGVLAARPAIAQWGATEAERERVLPGDELVGGSVVQTHAVTIDAPPPVVWPWLKQMGQGRGGFYSHDRLERLVGAQIRNADRVHPEWQDLAVGDLLRTYRPLPRFEPLGWYVATVDEERALVVHEPARDGVINSSWSLVLEEHEGRTRLLSRWRFHRRGARALFGALVFDPAHFIMETGALKGIKRRAESGSQRSRPAAAGGGR